MCLYVNIALLAGCSGVREGCGKGCVLLCQFCPWTAGDHSWDQVSRLPGHLNTKWGTKCCSAGRQVSEVVSLTFPWKNVYWHLTKIDILEIVLEVFWPFLFFFACRHKKGLKKLVNRYHSLIDNLNDAEFSLMADQVQELRRVLSFGCRRVNWNFLGMLHMAYRLFAYLIIIFVVASFVVLEVLTDIISSFALVLQVYHNSSNVETRPLQNLSPLWTKFRRTNETLRKNLNPLNQQTFSNSQWQIKTDTYQVKSVNSHSKYGP